MTPASPWRGVAALATAVLLACAACGSDEAPSPAAGTAPAETPATAPPATAAPPLDPVGLEPLVVDDAPQGFALADDAVGSTGATDLAAAAADSPDPGAGAALGEAGFVRGWQRLWVSDDGDDELFLLVYEFATPDGASAFLARTAAPAAGGEGVFDVPGIPGAIGVGAAADGLAVHAVVYATGPYLVQVIGNGPEPGPSQGTVIALAAAQAARLP